MRMLTIGLFIGMPNAFGRICIHMLVFYILIVISQSYPQQSWYCTLSTSQFELFRVVGLHQWMWEMNIPDYCKDFYLNQWPCRLTWHSCTDWMQSSWLSVVFQMERRERSTEQGDYWSGPHSEGAGLHVWVSGQTGMYVLYVCWVLVNSSAL